jgi:hypothetical protein
MRPSLDFWLWLMIAVTIAGLALTGLSGWTPLQKSSGQQGLENGRLRQARP